MGAPVLLLHGWGASAALFAPVMERLEHAFDLIAPDFPGFGATPPPPAGWSVGDYAAWTRDLLDSLALERVHIIGHSFGGRVAIALAARWPERVDRLVLTASAGLRPRRSPAYWRRVYTYKALKRLAAAPLVPPAARARLRARVERRGSQDYRQATGTMRETFVKVVNEDLRAALPRISAPALLVWGDADTETPLADGQAMERLIPDAGLVVFAGAGHYAYLEQPARFCHIVDTFFTGAP